MFRTDRSRSGARACALSILLALYLSACTARAATIKGTVVTWDGKPPAGAKVYLIGRSAHDPDRIVVAASTTTGRTGIFVLSGLKPQPYVNAHPQILVWHPGAALFWEAITPQTPSPLRVTLSHPHPVTLRVLDLAGRPVPAALVTFDSLYCASSGGDIPPRLARQWAVPTDRSGRAVLSLMADGGGGRVTVSAPGYGTGSRRLGVDEGKHVVILGPRRTIRGRIVSSDPHMPLGGIRIGGFRDWHWPEFLVADAVTDGAGRFVLPDAGTHWQILVALRSPADGRGSWLGWGHVIARGGQDAAAVVLPMRASPCTAGVVRVKDSGTGRGIPGLFVSVSPEIRISFWLGEEGPVRFGPTDKDGVCRVSMPPGKYQVSVAGDIGSTKYGDELTLPSHPTAASLPEVVLPAHHFIFRAHSLAGAAPRVAGAQPAFPRPGIITASPDRSPRPDRVISGHVVDSRGRPLGAVRVWACSQSPCTFTDASGAFTLDGLYNSPTFLFAFHKGYHLTARAFESPTGTTTFTLLRDGQPVPPLPTTAKTPPVRPDPAFVRSTARSILDEALAASREHNPLAASRSDLLRRLAIAGGDRDDVTGKWRGGLLGCLALVDPARALDAAAKDADRDQTAMLEILADQAFPQSPKDAVAFLNRISDPGNRAEALAALVYENSAAYPDQARQVAPAALMAVKSVTKPDDRMYLLGRFAPAIADLGLPEGRALGQELAAGSPSPPFEDLKKEAASVIARYDLDAAMVLLDSAHDSPFEGNRWCVWGCVGRAQLDRALDAIRRDPDPEEQDLSLEIMATRFAVTDPEKASRIGSLVHDPLSPTNVFLRLAETAAFTRPDAARAWLKVARSRTSLFTRPDTGIARGEYIRMCHLDAYLHDPAAAEDALWVLAQCRPRGGLTGLTRDSNALDAAVGALAVSDLSFARRVVEMATPEALCLKTKDYGDASGINTAVIRNWLLIDPVRARTLVDRLIAAHSDINLAEVVRTGLGVKPEFPQSSW